MSKGYDETILKHYEAQAIESGLEPTSTMLDLTVRERETELIEKFVGLVLGPLGSQSKKDTGFSICDVGCGNGYTLSKLSECYPEASLQGYEFTPSLLKLAESRFKNVGNVNVSHGDVRSLGCLDRTFDLVTCQRVLINLLDPADQRRGLSELARITKPGGYLLIIEAFEEPLARLNEARQEFDLPPLEPAHHNLYISSDFFAAEPSLTPVTGTMIKSGLPQDFLPSNFLSSHYFVSRVLHPLALGPGRPFTRNSHFVRFMTAALDRPAGDYAPIKAYAFQKLAETIEKA